MRGQLDTHQLGLGVVGGGFLGFLLLLLLLCVKYIYQKTKQTNGGFRNEIDETFSLCPYSAVCLHHKNVVDISDKLKLVG